METRVLYTIEVTAAREERCNPSFREKGKRTTTAKGIGRTGGGSRKIQQHAFPRRSHPGRRRLGGSAGSSRGKPCWVDCIIHRATLTDCHCHTLCSHNHIQPKVLWVIFSQFSLTSGVLAPFLMVSCCFGNIGMCYTNYELPESS